MSSASTGVRIVARALPGSGGSAARARASAACLAAWRAAQGAAPRRPSLRLRLPASSLPAAAFGCAVFAAAVGFVAFVAAAFFVFAISISVGVRSRKQRGPKRPFPLALPEPARLGDLRETTLRPLPELPQVRPLVLGGGPRGELVRKRTATTIGRDMAVHTEISESEARAILAEYGSLELHRVEGIAGGSVNSNFALTTSGDRLFLRVYEEQGRAGAEHETALLERRAGAGVPTPPPLRRLDGGLVSTLRGKPVAVFPWRV